MTRVTVEILPGAPKYIKEVPGGEPLHVRPGRILSVDAECFDESYMVAVQDEGEREVVTEEPATPLPEAQSHTLHADDSENEWVIGGVDSEEE